VADNLEMANRRLREEHSMAKAVLSNGNTEASNGAAPVITTANHAAKALGKEER
jgi:hypothetical protein